MVNNYKAILFDVCAKYDFSPIIEDETNRIGIMNVVPTIYVYLNLDEEEKLQSIDMKIETEDENEIVEKVSMIQSYFSDVDINLTHYTTMVIPAGSRIKTEEQSKEDIEKIREEVIRRGTIDFSDKEAEYDKAIEEGRIEADIYDEDMVIQRMYDYLEDVEAGDIKLKDYDKKLERIVKYSDEEIKDNPAQVLYEKLKDKTIKTIKEIKEFIDNAKKEREENIEYAEPSYYTDEELFVLEQLNEEMALEEEQTNIEDLLTNSSKGILDLQSGMKGEAKDIAGILTERRQEQAQFGKTVLRKFNEETGIETPEYLLDELNDVEANPTDITQAALDDLMDRVMEYVKEQGQKYKQQEQEKEEQVEDIEEETEEVVEEIIEEPVVVKKESKEDEDDFKDLCKVFLDDFYNDEDDFLLSDDLLEDDFFD